MENEINPLYQASTPSLTPKPALPRDPKTIILIIMASVILILIILAVGLSLTKRRPSSYPGRPIHFPTLTPTPTVVVPTPQVLLPPQFDQIENDLKSSFDFPPPDIDPNLSL